MNGYSYIIIPPRTGTTHTLPRKKNEGGLKKKGLLGVLKVRGGGYIIIYDERSSSSQSASQTDKQTVCCLGCLPLSLFFDHMCSSSSICKSGNGERERE